VRVFDARGEWCLVDALPGGRAFSGHDRPATVDTLHCGRRYRDGARDERSSPTTAQASSAAARASRRLTVPQVLINSVESTFGETSVLQAVGRGPNIQVDILAIGLPHCLVLQGSRV